MILQRNKKICIFGSGDGKGSIEFCGNKVDFASENGAFKAYLPEMEAGGPYEMTVKLNGKTEILTDILVGDVYIAGGQSNMAVTVYEAVDVTPRECDSVRLFKECHNADAYSGGLDFYTKNSWEKATLETSLSFSAIAFEFAMQLHGEIGVPVGIVVCCNGASRIDAWTAPEIVEREEYQALMPTKHGDSEGYIFNKDCWLYRNKLVHIAPLTVSGVLFYQGESNTGCDEAKNYGKLFEYMANNWRELFCAPTLPFYTVQIASFRALESQANWAEIRSQQAWASKNVPYTYLVTMANTGEGKLIHPYRKKDLGDALCNAVLNIQFGYDVEYSGPICEKIEQIDHGIKVTFSHADGLHVVGQYLDG